MCASFSAFGQTYTGSIAGTVTDPSGSAVPNAKVTITDVAKGFTYTAQTDNGGLFTVRNLPPSTYTETIDASGFTRFERPNIVVEVTGNVNVNAQLQLANAAQTVTVTEAGSTQLQTEDATTGQTINRAYINDLPNITRSVFDLAYLAPGVSQPPGNAYGNVSQNFGNNFVSGGERNAQADILIDGISTTSVDQNSGFSQPLYTPSVEAVQEFKLQQSNFSAEIGFSAGSVINLVTRSGTNQIHGELYEFLRNTDFDANQFFSNANGLARSKYNQSNFGGTVGGPVIKNKLFYFFDYDETRTISPSGAPSLGVPSAQERAGNFGELCGNVGGTFSAAGQCSAPAGQIWDPYSAIQNNAYGNGGLRQNFIPFNNMANYASPNTTGSPGITPGVRGNIINPITQKVISYFPLPNSGGTPGTTSYNPYNNFFSNISNVGNNGQFDIKLDSRFTDRDQISVRFSHQSGSSQIGNIFGNALDAFTQGPTSNVALAGALNYTHIFNPTTLLTVTAGYDHAYANTAGNLADFPNFSLQTLGFTPAVAAQLTQSGYNGLPSFRISNYSGENGNANIGGQPFSGLIYGRDVYHLAASVSKTAGGHDLHMGAEFRSHRINFTQFGEPNGLFGFNQSGTSQFQSNGGDSLATFLTGFANDWSAYEIPASPATQNLQYGGFIQDNWHVNSRLTVNLGVRYDVDHSRTERHNEMSYFDLNAPSPLAGVPGVPATGSLEYVGLNGASRNPYSTFYGGFGPRVGIAYRVRDNWTIRTGYGIFYDASKYGAAGTGSGGAGFLGYDAQTSFQNYNNNLNYVPQLIVGQPLTIGGVTGQSQGITTALGNTLNGIPIYQYGSKLPQEQTWSFGIERQLPFNVLIDAEYVGRKGTHLYFGGDTHQLNHLSDPVGAQFLTNAAGLNANVPTPTALTNAIVAQTPAYSNGFYGGTWPAYNAYLPYPQYPIGPYGSSGLQNVDPPLGNSIYHAFQLRVEKRMSRGFQALFTYSAQKSIDDSSLAGSSVYIDGTAGATLANVQDPNNLRLERSLSQFDISQIAQFTALYQLPFGKGQTFGSSWNRLVDGIFGGWKLNGIYRWDTGLPIVLSLAGGTSVPTWGAQRPNLPYQLQPSGNYGPNGNFFTNGPQSQATLAGWVPAPYALGNAPRVLPNIRAEGTNNVNASLMKQFPLGFREGALLEFRAETFNLLNRTQFSPPATTVGQTSNFGIVTGQANQPRLLQLALKLYF